MDWIGRMSACCSGNSGCLSPTAYDDSCIGFISEKLVGNCLRVILGWARRGILHQFLFVFQAKMQGHQVPAINSFIIRRDQMKRLDLGFFEGRLVYLVRLAFTGAETPYSKIQIAQLD